MDADPVIVVIPTKLGESILISDFADNVHHARDE
jgi:hypothetical protein